MKSLSLLSLATVASGALSDLKLDGLKLDGFDFDSLDILGGKAAAVKKPWYLGGPLPSKGPFGASIPIHLFLDEYVNATILDIDGITLELACLEGTTGGSVSALIFGVDTGKESSGLFDVGFFTGQDFNFVTGLPACGANSNSDGTFFPAGLRTFITSGSPGSDEFSQPFRCVYENAADPNTADGDNDPIEQRSPYVLDVNWFDSKFSNGAALTITRESLGLFVSNTTANAKSFDALCGVWGNIDIKIPKGVPFSVVGYDKSDLLYRGEKKA